jgi:hypothetical protein
VGRQRAVVVEKGEHAASVHEGAARAGRAARGASFRPNPASGAAVSGRIDLSALLLPRS